MCFVMVVVEGSGYVLLASVREAVCVVHRSRLVGVEGSEGLGEVFFLGFFGMLVEVAI